jgi:hypothetical protein
MLLLLLVVVGVMVVQQRRQRLRLQQQVHLVIQDLAHPVTMPMTTAVGAAVMAAKALKQGLGVVQIQGLIVG